MSTTTRETFTAYRLANIADVGCPDTLDSPGAQFLLGVQMDVHERTDDGSFDEDTAHEIADGAVPVYTHDLFETMTDLAAYHEDVSGLGTPEDATQAAQWALYQVAYRLVCELRESDEEE